MTQLGPNKQRQRARACRLPHGRRRTPGRARLCARVRVRTSEKRCADACACIRLTRARPYRARPARRRPRCPSPAPRAPPTLRPEIATINRNKPQYAAISQHFALHPSSSRARHPLPRPLFPRQAPVASLCIPKRPPPPPRRPEGGGRGPLELAVPVLLYLVFGDTFREVHLSAAPMDVDVGDGLILGCDWISSHDLRHRARRPAPCR